jgi:phosphate starvation-inducible protein PhoH and related proteins
MSEKLISTDNTDILSEIFGNYDSNISIIEKRFGVDITSRGSTIVISGDSNDKREKAYSVLQYLNKIATLGESIEEQKVVYALEMVEGDNIGELKEFEHNLILINSKGKPIKAKTIGQQKYVEAIKKNTIVFGIGPAGTGKTYLAVAMAVAALREKKVSRIILTRPAVEAGERLGYLPGDLQSKIDPYLRPLFDSLYDTMGVEAYQRNSEKGIIEIAPLAYMRGRTLDDSFIILDEAQNTTPEQMKMFLTRLGYGSKIVVTGDITQTDLPKSQKSGLVEAASVVKDIDDIEVFYFTDKDVVRHCLVQKIILAYEKHYKEKNTELRPKKIYRKKETK